MMAMCVKVVGIESEECGEKYPKQQEAVLLKGSVS